MARRRSRSGEPVTATLSPRAWQAGPTRIRAREVCAIKLKVPPTDTITLQESLAPSSCADVAGGILDNQFEHPAREFQCARPGRRAHDYRPRGSTICWRSACRSRLAHVWRPRRSRASPARSPAGGRSPAKAAALGGVAGHAGCCATRSASALARAVLGGARAEEPLVAPFSPRSFAEFTTKSTVPGGSRARSSCGEQMSRRAFGHVVAARRSG